MIVEKQQLANHTVPVKGKLKNLHMFMFVMVEQ